MTGRRDGALYVCCVDFGRRGSVDRQDSLGTASMSDEKIDPIKRPEFQKAARRFIIGNPKPHEEMRAGKSRGQIGPKNKPPRRGAGK
jgi:hypothetical protein